MINADTFIGTVALVIGVAAALSAIFNTAAYSRFWLSRALESSFGNVVARIAGVVVGMILAIIGLLLLNGILPLKNAEMKRSPRVASSIEIPTALVHSSWMAGFATRRAA